MNKKKISNNLILLSRIITIFTFCFVPYANAFSESINEDSQHSPAVINLEKRATFQDDAFKDLLEYSIAPLVVESNNYSNRKLYITCTINIKNNSVPKRIASVFVRIFTLNQLKIFKNFFNIIPLESVNYTQLVLQKDCTDQELKNDIEGINKDNYYAVVRPIIEVIDNRNSIISFWLVAPGFSSPLLINYYEFNHTNDETNDSQFNKIFQSGIRFIRLGFDEELNWTIPHIGDIQFNEAELLFNAQQALDTQVYPSQPELNKGKLYSSLLYRLFNEDHLYTRQALITEAELELRLYNTGRAVTILEDLTPYEEKTIDLLYDAAMQYEGAELYDSAIKIYKQLSTNKNESVNDVYVKIADAYFLKGDWDSSESYYKQYFGIIDCDFKNYSLIVDKFRGKHNEYAVSFIETAKKCIPFIQKNNSNAAIYMFDLAELSLLLDRTDLAGWYFEQLDEQFGKREDTVARYYSSYANFRNSQIIRASLSQKEQINLPLDVWADLAIAVERIKDIEPQYSDVLLWSRGDLLEILVLNRVYFGKYNFYNLTGTESQIEKRRNNLSLQNVENSILKLEEEIKSYLDIQKQLKNYSKTDLQYLEQKFYTIFYFLSSLDNILNGRPVIQDEPVQIGGFVGVERYGPYWDYKYARNKLDQLSTYHCSIDDVMSCDRYLKALKFTISMDQNIN